MGERQSTLTQQERRPVRDHCGILAAFSLGGDVPLFHDVIAGLKTLQTRGYDGAGLCALSTDGQVYTLKGEGLITDIFTPKVMREEIGRKAKLWVAQARYGTNGGFIEENVQPFNVNHNSGDVFFVAHNGQFASTPGSPPTELSDTYLFAKELEQSSGETLDERILTTVRKKKGAFSLIVGTKNALYLIRDSEGVRPLVYGEIKGPNGTPVIVAASETEALIRMGVSRFFEVMPGTAVKFSDNQDGITIPLFTEDVQQVQGPCIVEDVYTLDGQSRTLASRSNPEDINMAPLVFTTRQRAGEILAQEAPLSTEDVDFAIGIPGTGIPGGEGYARACGIPYYQAITDKKKQGDPRTFMSAKIDSILAEVLKHFNFDRKALRGKRVVLIDDSIVRGNVSLGLVRLLKEQYGVKEVHLRVLSPPIDKPCHLGINTRSANELIAARHGGDIEGIRKELGADSLAYLSAEGLKESITGDPLTQAFCMACMAGFTHRTNEFGEELQRTEKNVTIE